MSRILSFSTCAVLFALLFCPTQSQAQGSEELAEKVLLTVYNNDLAVVKDRRKMTLPEGAGQVQFSDVATRIDPTSVHFESLTDPEGTSVLEQNYEYDLVSPTKLLDKFLDRQVDLFTKEGNVFTGTLLSQAEGRITLRDEEGKLQVVSGGENLVRVELANLPEGLITRPTLVWETFSKTGGPQLCQVTYMTGGINWKADYVMVVAPDDKKLDLNGWVTLDNQSGATYKEAALKLIAGDVHRAEEPRAFDLSGGRKMAMSAEDAKQAFEEKAFFEYHLYTLQRPTTIRQSQTKQVTLLSAQDVSADKVFEYNGSRNGKKVEVKMEFKNSEENNMGMALPKGKVRAFKADSDGSLEFIGEDTIDHTPKDEKLRVLLGNAFDIVGERNQIDFKDLGMRRVVEETWEIKLRNHKEEDVVVKVVEPVRGDWKVMKTSHEFKKKDANTLEFEVSVPVDGEVVVTYVVRIKE